MTSSRPDMVGLSQSFQPRMWFPHGFDGDGGRIMWVYKPSNEDPDTYEVGFFCPDGTWMPEGTFDTKEQAAERVNWLNGGGG